MHAKKKSIYCARVRKGSIINDLPPPAPIVTFSLAAFLQCLLRYRKALLLSSEIRWVCTLPLLLKVNDGTALQLWRMAAPLGRSQH